MLNLGQTLARSWVITTPNPEERHVETHLGEFRTDAMTPGTPVHTAMEQSAAQTVVALALATRGGILVTSHNHEERDRMADLVRSVCDGKIRVETL